MGKTYFDAYCARRVRNEERILTIAAGLREAGCRTFASEPSYGKVNFVKFFHPEDKKQACFGFGQVPYHWYLHVDIKPDLNLGSSKTVDTWYDLENPPGADVLLPKMAPIWCSVETYEKRLWYLTEIK